MANCRASTEGSRFRQATTDYARTLTSVGELIKPAARQGGVLDAKEVKESVSRLTDSVVRNPDAMLLVTRLREKSAEAHARALQVSIYLLVFARFLQLPRDDLELLGLLGLLQDIGKTRLPPELMEKKGPLTAEETELARRHVEYSAEILAATPGLPPKLPEPITSISLRAWPDDFPDAIAVVRRAPYESRTDSRNPASFAVALYCGIGSRSLNALVNAFDRLHSVRG